MNQRVECPVCESRFSTETVRGEMQICPHCNRSFKITQATLIQTTGSVSRSTPTVAGPVHPKLATPAVVPVSAQTIPETKPSAESGLAVDMERADRRVRSGRYKPRKSPVVVITVLSLVAIGMAIALPFFLDGAFSTPESEDVARQQAIRDAIAAAESGEVPELNPMASRADISDRDLSNNRTEQNRTLPMPDAIGVADNGAANSGTNSGAGTDGESLLQPRAAEPPPPAELKFLKQSEFDDVWRLQQRRVVRLIISTPLGRHHALGTIVDTRGWVVTSYRAVAGATQISVVQTASNIDDFRANQFLTDEARGVIAVDKAHDIAILSINRRFIVDFSSIKLSDRDSVVGSQTFAQFGFLNSESQDTQQSPLTRREIMISKRMKFSDFLQKQQESLAALGLGNADVGWITHTTQENTTPGSPLIDMQGVFHAFISAASFDDRKLAFSAKHVGDLIATATDDPQPLSMLSSELAEIGMQEMDVAETVGFDHPLHDPIVNLNKAAAACARFNGVPSNESEYKLMQEFLMRANLLRSYLEDGEESDPGVVRVREQLEQQEEHFFAALKPETGIDEATVRAVNAIAIEIVRADERSEADRYIVAFTTVLRGAMDSPRLNGIETITMQITGFENGVFIPYSEDQPVARDESRWLLAFKLPEAGARATKIKAQNGVSIPTQHVELLGMLGPID